MARERNRYEPAKSCVEINLRDTNKNWAGILRLNASTPGDPKPDTSSELIAISRGLANDLEVLLPKLTLREWAFIGYIKTEDPYEFYNVPWVEWVNGIAYRKAIGRVWKPVWDRQDLAEIDAILG